MKKVLVAGLFGLLSLAVASSCFAGTYFAGNIGIVAVSDAAITSPEWTATGWTDAEISFDNGVGLSLAVGSTISDIVRAEGEFSYRKNDLDSLSYNDSGVPVTNPISGDEGKAMSLMGNVFVDIKNDSAITPFLGLGLGFAKIELEAGGESKDDTVFAYQIILGTGFKVNDSTSIDVSYRYFATADPDFDGTEIEFATHNFMAGVRLSF
jgi:opacity protein-like surface antigen